MSSEFVKLNIDLSRKNYENLKKASSLLYNVTNQMITQNPALANTFHLTSEKVEDFIVYTLVNSYVNVINTYGKKPDGTEQQQ